MLKPFIVALVSYAALDLAWVGLVAKRFYRTELGALIRHEPDWTSVLPIYLLFAAGIVLFVLPKAGGSLQATAGWGALFGLVVYGVYDFTNQAVLQGWSWRLTAVDVLWGATVGAAVSVMALKIPAWIS